MRVVLQRVGRAAVSVDDRVVAAIGSGLLLLVGIEQGDGPETVTNAVDKISVLRVFSDELGKMNLSIGEVGGQVLVVSQFTLLGDASRGRRPSFTRAAGPGDAAPLVDAIVEQFRGIGIDTLQGVFGATMMVELVNDGPVTLVLEFGGASSG